MNNTANGRLLSLDALRGFDMLQGIVDFRKAAKYFFGSLADAVPDAFGPVVLSAGYLALCWLVLWFLYRKNTFLKV